jgi:hypothetical protein
MRTTKWLGLALLLAAPAAAQVGESEIIVTGTRISRPNLEGATIESYRPPAIGLKRTADFAVQQVTIVGDTRDTEKRRDEILAMVRGAIDLAARRGGIELATGTFVVEPLTTANYRNLPLEEDDERDETERVTFLVKTRLTGGIDAKAALERIEAYIKTVPAVGRAEMEKTGDLTLSVVGPDQYRAAIVDKVAADARAMAARLGPDYKVEALGLDRAVEWSRASLTEVYLYVPYSYSVVAAR